MEILETLETLVPLDQQDNQEMQEARVSKVHQGQEVLLEHQVPLDQWDLLDPEEI